MSFLLEKLAYQKKAIAAVVGVFEGQQRNFFHNPFQGDVNPNILTLGNEEITANKRAIIAGNSLTEGEAHLCTQPDDCIEIEAGIGKTLVFVAWNERIKDATLKRLRELDDSGVKPFFIYLERSLSTTTKWNVAHL